MDDIKMKKKEIRKEAIDKLASISRDERKAKSAAIEERLFDLANFREAAFVLMYTGYPHGFDTSDVISRLAQSSKEIVLPLFGGADSDAKMFKIIDPGADIVRDPDPEPDPERCKEIAIEQIDIAIIPGIAFDEKGGRLGLGTGRYDRLIPRLPNTTRKVVLAFEEQVVPQVPMQSHDKHVDIIITDKRIIYKI